MTNKNLWVVITAAVITLLSTTSCSYNTMVEKDEAVQAAWSQVENQYQRRTDLIPNLVSTVKGYAAHESATLQSVTDARTKAMQINVDASNLTPDKLQQFQAAQGDLSQALGKLMMVREAYPDLKANQNFLELQAQLEGTENRIATERMRFNEAARDYNTYIRRFPNNLISGMFDFESKPYFEAEAGADKPVDVKF